MTAAPAVIFDIDGVLVDSYQVHYHSWQQLAADHGQRMSEAEFAATFGRTSREIISELWPDVPPSQIPALDLQKETHYRQQISHHFPVMPGAAALVQALHRDGFRLAVGSSGPPENVKLAVRQLDLDQVLGAAVSGADVRRGKPAPDVFLTAAERLEVAPEDCAVVEDARAGIAAAHAAGMVAIALVSCGHTHDELREADLVVDRLDQISPDTIRRLIGSKGHGQVH